MIHMTKKWSALFLGLLMCSSMIVFGQTTEEVLSKHQAAMGSPEKWSAVKSLVMKNKFSVQGMDIESKTSVLVGQGFRTEVEVMGNKIITAINGDSGWMIRPAMMGGTGEPETMPNEQVKMASSQKNQLRAGFFLWVAAFTLAAYAFIQIPTPVGQR